MPCRDPGWEEEDRNYTSSLVQEQQEQIDKLTALLCYACRILEGSNVRPKMELQQWYTEHKKADEVRLKREAEERNQALRQEYLASVKERLMTQLSPDELEALNLK